MHSASSPATPAAGGETHQQQQQQGMQHLDAAATAAQKERQVQQQKARQKLEHQHKQAMAAAQGLFGQSTAVAFGRTAPASMAPAIGFPQMHSLPSISAAAAELQQLDEIITGPQFFPIPGHVPAGPQPPRDVQQAGTARLKSSSSPLQHITPAQDSEGACSAGSCGSSGNGSSRAATALEGHSVQRHQAELQAILTELLAPAPDAVDSDARADAAGARDASATSGDSLPGPRAAAARLAGACAEWVLQPAQQQLLQEQPPDAAWLGASCQQHDGLPAKPLSAPSHMQAQLQRPSMASTNAEQSRSSLTGSAALHHDMACHVSVRPASAPPAAARSSTAQQGWRAGQHHQAGSAGRAVTTGNGHSSTDVVNTQQASWSALAAAHGLLGHREAGLFDAEPPAQQHGQYSEIHMLQTAGTAAAGAAADLAASGSSQELVSSSCSSLPSIPSATGCLGPAAQQHRRKPSAAAAAQHGPAGGTCTTTPQQSHVGSPQRQPVEHQTLPPVPMGYKVAGLRTPPPSAVHSQQSPGYQQQQQQQHECHSLNARGCAAAAAAPGVCQKETGFVDAQRQHMVRAGLDAVCVVWDRAHRMQRNSDDWCWPPATCTNACSYCRGLACSSCCPLRLQPYRRCRASQAWTACISCWTACSRGSAVWHLTNCSSNSCSCSGRHSSHRHRRKDHFKMTRRGVVRHRGLCRSCLGLVSCSPLMMPLPSRGCNWAAGL